MLGYDSRNLCRGKRRLVKRVEAVPLTPSPPVIKLPFVFPVALGIGRRRITSLERTLGPQS